MTRTTTRSVLAMVTAIICLVGCAAMRREQVRSKEDMLAAAGFRQKLVDSPARQQTFATMPPLKMVRRVKDGALVFTYADPYNCKCLYVGDETNYQAYKRLVAEQRMAQDEAAAAMALEDASMDPEWGPWWP